MEPAILVEEFCGILHVVQVSGYDIRSLQAEPRVVSRTLPRRLRDSLSPRVRHIVTGVLDHQPPFTIDLQMTHSHLGHINNLSIVTGLETTASTDSLDIPRNTR